MSSKSKNQGRRGPLPVVMSPITTLATSPASAMRLSGNGNIGPSTPLDILWSGLPGTGVTDGTSRVSSVEFTVQAFGASTVGIPYGVMNVTLFDAQGVEQVVSRQINASVTAERYKLRMPKSCNFEFAASGSNAVKFTPINLPTSNDILVTYVINYTVKGLQ